MCRSKRTLSSIRTDSGTPTTNTLVRVIESKKKNKAYAEFAKKTAHTEMHEKA